MKSTQVNTAGAVLTDLGIERLCQLRDWVRTTKTQ